jgi:hypothetical protein
MAKNVTVLMAIAAAGPYRFSSGRCMYPRKPSSSVTAATTAVIAANDTNIQIGIFELSCESRNAPAGRCANRSVASHASSLKRAPARAAKRPQIQTFRVGKPRAYSARAAAVPFGQP